VCVYMHICVRYELLNGNGFPRFCLPQEYIYS